MANRYIKRRSVQISLPEATYRSAELLAQREDKTLSRYLLSLVEREVQKQGLPVYFMEYHEEE